MSQLSRADVEYIAYLARLELSEAEKAVFQEQLSAILEYAEKIQVLDTADVPPTTSALPLSNVMRADEIQPGLSIEAALTNAPAAEENSFRVKPVLGSSQAQVE